MPSKVQFYAQMAEQAAAQITGSYQSWISFLETAGRLYKYPYAEQLMIHAQRPDATACAAFDFWNQQWGRYIRQGSRGIALLDTSSEYPRLRYVFDVSDTGTRENSRAVRLWQLREEHHDSISTMLEQTYDVSGENGLREQLEGVAAQLADEYWAANQQDILDNVANSFLSEYDDYNVGVQFRSAATVSTAYALMSRCGLEPGAYYQHEDFLSVFDFNTPAAVAALGTAVSEINQQVLRQIEVTIRSYEREHSAERTKNHGRDDLQDERRLSDPQPEPARTGADTAGQVRTDAESISEGAQTGSVEPAASVGAPVPAPAGDRRDGEPSAGADDARADEAERRDGGAESIRPDEMDGPDEQPESAGGGDDPERADLRITQPSVQQLSFFPTEAEQIEIIDQGTGVFETPVPFSLSIPQPVIDGILRLAGNRDSGRMEIIS